jgi:hypothetical protein
MIDGSGRLPRARLPTVGDHPGGYRPVGQQDVGGGRPTSPARLRELARAYAGAEARLHRAEQEGAAHRD